MTRQFPHPFTDLPGHNPSKVRGADCITASASEALDVRVLKVAEWIMRESIRHYRPDSGHAEEYTRTANDLRAIAAEIRADATPRRQVPETNEVIAIRNADTVTRLRDVWAGLLARRPDMEPHERIRLLERALERLLVIEARHKGDGK